jgi:hypothetical protein
MSHLKNQQDTDKSSYLCDIMGKQVMEYFRGFFLHITKSQVMDCGKFFYYYYHYEREENNVSVVNIFEQKWNLIYNLGQMDYTWKRRFYPLGFYKCSQSKVSLFTWFISSFEFDFCLW